MGDDRVEPSGRRMEKRAQRALDKIKIPELVKDEKKVRFSRSQWAW
jgi:hypothetical protein